MAKKQSGLGKGLDSLLTGPKPTSNVVLSHAGVSEIAIEKITPNPNQPRKTFNDAVLQDLADSIKEHGVITPITVKKSGVDSYQIIAGERRWRASKLLGLAKIPAFVREAEDDNKLLVLGLVENLQRENLDPIEVAQAYQRLIEEGGLTQEQLGKQVGKNHATIANSLRLLKLSPEIQVGLMNGDISEGHAKSILSLDDENKQKEIYTEIIAKGLSVRATEDLVRRLKDGKKPSKKIAKSKEQKEIQERISTKLNTKIALSVTERGSGKISIPFKNARELEAIVALFDKI